MRAYKALLVIVLFFLATICVSGKYDDAALRLHSKSVAHARSGGATEDGFALGGPRPSLRGARRAEDDHDHDGDGHADHDAAEHDDHDDEHEDHDDGHEDHDDDDDHDDHADHAEENSASAALNLRIAAVFVTGLVTLIGMAPFFATSPGKISQKVILCVRAAAAGTMLSLAVVHIGPEAAHKLEKITPFPLAGTLMAVGVLISYVFQLVFHHAPHDREAKVLPDVESAGPVKTLLPMGAVTLPVVGAPMPMMDPGATGMVHQCCSCAVGSETGSTTFQVSGDDRVPDEIVIRSMEAGCIVHSLILGLALGLEPNFNTGVILFTVFSVHQFLEGLALGYLISGIKSSLEKICAVVLTMVSMPLGVAIGLLVSVFGDVKSANATAGPITACMSSIAGGLLLYTTLTNFTGEDLKRSDVLADGNLRAAMGLSFLVGLASMTAVSAGEVANGSHVH